MLVGIYLAWYFTGPIAAELARNAFEIFYSWRNGYIPSVWSFEYYTTFMPMRGHVTHYAYLYANKICVLIAAPIFYKLPDVIFAFFKSSPLDADLASEKSEQFPKELADAFLGNHTPSFLIAHATKQSANQSEIEESRNQAYRRRCR